MEPERQVEIQLGHLCNNRCVFCVSGQRTQMGEARPLPVAPALERISEARAAGHTKITLLGGEPTLQPGFLGVVAHCAALGFEEVVVFTNGVRTARAEFIDAVLATGAKVTWRISIQGGTEAAHVRTTGKPRSFQRILRTLENLRAREAPVTVNMCVVASNIDSVPAFPELVERFGIRQLHLDLMRPLDAGKRTETELRAMMPRLRELVAPLSTMIAGFEARLPGFDVNIGNLPYCVAPHLAPWIHHDGSMTQTVAIDGDDRLSRPWNKYLTKRRDKIKPDRCRECVFDDACSGVFETYARMHGTDELVPVSSSQLAGADPGGRLLARRLRPLTRALRARGFDCWERGAAEIEVARDGGRFVIAREAGPARCRDFGITVAACPDPADALVELASLLDQDYGTIVPLACPPSERTIAARLRRLSDAAPFPRLRWRRTEVRPGRAEAWFDADDGGGAVVWFTEEGRRAGGGYRPVGEPTAGLREGLGHVLRALRPRLDASSMSAERGGPKA